ncbi:MAG: hypothetical protein VX899_01135 [Myxococcota bacterium]|nr:hypothetical protein [Myxococcota bacterium]
MKKRILDRLRKLSGAPEAAGGAWTPRLQELWPELEPQAGGQGELLAAAVTATWEVGLADLGRALRAKHPDHAKAVVERTSDALVPLLTPVQALSTELEACIRQGGTQAQQSGQLLDAAAPTVALLRDIGPRLHQGWTQLVDYLELPVGESARSGLHAIGPLLEQEADALAVAFHRDCARLPQEELPELALMGALDTWRRAQARSLEMNLYQARTLLLAAL